MRSLQLMARFLGAAWIAASANAQWDARFYLPGVQGEVRANAVSGNDLYAAGQFSSADDVALTNIAKWNGTNWVALGGGVNGAVNAIVVRGSDVFVGGTFSQAGGVAASLVARWNGANWSALGAGLAGVRVTALAVDAAGALYAGGEFTNAGGVAVANIARWNGANWSALGSGLSNDPYSAWVLALAVRGTELFAGGFFTDAGGVNVSCIARWSGSAWSSVGGGVDDRDYLPQVTALAVSGNDLYVGGAFTTAGPAAAGNVARWNGAAWSALGSGLERFFGDVPVTALAVSGSRLVVGGRFVSAGGTAANNLAVWDGANWAELGGGATGEINSLAIDGPNVVVGGAFSVVGQAIPLALAQWNGSTWSNVTAGGGQGVFGTRSCVQTPSCSGDNIAALVRTGRVVYAGGAFTLAGGVNAANIASWTGTHWSPLGGGLDGPVFALALSGGDLIAAGGFGAAGFAPALNIARWNGADWSPMGDGINGTVFAIAVSESQVFAGGVFAAAGGVTASNVARWNGANWSAVGGGVNGPVYALAIDGSNLFIGGKFTSAGGVNATNVARWNGSQWSALGNGVGGVANPIARLRPPPVSALAVHGSDLFVGGDFAFAGGVPATNIARWDGQNWSSVAGGLPGPSSFAPPPSVAALMAQDGRLWVGGSFLRAGGLTANGLAQWDGTNWSVFGGGATRGISSPPSVSALAAEDEGLCVAGHFKFAGGKPASDFSLWHWPPVLRLDRVGSRIIISWHPPVGILQRAPTVNGAWSVVPGTTAVITNDIMQPQQFYRVKL